MSFGIQSGADPLKQNAYTRRLFESQVAAKGSPTRPLPNEGDLSPLERLSEPVTRQESREAARRVAERILSAEKSETRASAWNSFILKPPSPKKRVGDSGVSAFRQVRREEEGKTNVVSKARIEQVAQKVENVQQSIGSLISLVSQITAKGPDRSLAQYGVLDIELVKPNCDTKRPALQLTFESVKIATEFKKRMSNSDLEIFPLGQSAVGVMPKFDAGCYDHVWLKNRLIREFGSMSPKHIEETVSNGDIKLEKLLPGLFQENFTYEELDIYPQARAVASKLRVARDGLKGKEMLSQLAASHPDYLRLLGTALKA